MRANVRAMRAGIALLLLSAACAAPPPPETAVGHGGLLQHLAGKTAASSASAAPPAQAAPPPRLDAQEESEFLKALAETHHFSLGTPHAIKVAPDGASVLFLRSGPRDPSQSLYKLDLHTGKTHLLVAPDKLLATPASLSPAERALRERLRQTTTGLSSFEVSKNDLAILLPLAGHLFVFDRMTGQAHELPVKGAFDAKLLPDGSRVAYVRDNDVFTMRLDGKGGERAVTRGGTAKKPHGMAEFVAQEEFDRRSGYFLSPDSKLVAFEEADQSGVDVLHIPDLAHPGRAPDNAFYPRAGRPNAVVRFGIAGVGGGAPVWVQWNNKAFPYVAKVTWEEGAPLCLYVMDRLQQNGELLAVDTRSGKTRVLVAEHDDAWLNLDTSVPRWMPDGKSFLWSTERHGAWELELREVSGAGSTPRSLLGPGKGYRRVVDLDPDHKRVIVEASTEPTQQLVVSVPLDGGAPTVVDNRPGMTTAYFGGKSHDVFVAREASAGAYARYVVRGVSSPRSVAVPSEAQMPKWTPHVEIYRVGKPEYRVAVVRPRGARPGVKRPVIDAAYGGPGVQIVQADATRFIREQYLADATGAIVVSIDARGTPGRDRAWERVLRGKLGEVPVAGHVEALRGLPSVVPEADLTRVGVFGWSFGGYFTADALLTHPELYKAGVAGAPPADWRDYDTAYTERYMGLPEHEAAAYDAASLLTMAQADRGSRRPLLLFHGTADDNVYFDNSLKLADALERAGQPFDFVPLLGQTHIVRDPSLTAAVWRDITTFLREHLAAPGSSAQYPHYL